MKEAGKEKQKLSNDLMSRQRTILMGIMILFIMVFHFTEDCKKFDFHFDGWIQWFWTYIRSSGVDTFLFLSGLGLYYSMKKNPDIKAFYKRRLIRIVIPYVLVALPAWIGRDFFYRKTGLWEFIKDFTFLSFKNGERWYWYILMILVCYLIFPYIFRIVEAAKNQIEGEMYFLAVAGAITIALMGMKLYAGDSYKALEIALTRFPIFIAGCFYGRSSYERRESYWKWGVILCVCIAALYLFPKNMPIFSRYIIGLLNVSVCAFLAVFFSKVRMNGMKKILEWCGNHSLELYLVHVTVRKVMISLGFKTCHYRYELVMIGVSFVLAWLLAVVSTQIQNRLSGCVKRENVEN